MGKLFLGKSGIKRKDGTYRWRYVLRESRWQTGAQGQGSVSQRYVGYVGPEPILSASKAEFLCQEKGISRSELESVNGLQILPDSEVPQRRLGRPRKPYSQISKDTLFRRLVKGGVIHFDGALVRAVQDDNGWIVTELSQVRFTQIEGEALLRSGDRIRIEVWSKRETLQTWGISPLELEREVKFKVRGVAHTCLNEKDEKILRLHSPSYLELYGGRQP